MARKILFYLKKILKGLTWFLAILFALIIIIVLAIRLPAVQQHITNKALNFYQEKVDAHADLERLYVDFPSNITIEGLYLEDQNQDTLLFLDYLTIQTDLWELTNKKLNLSYINIRNSQGNIERKNQDSTFNFQFIIDAFAAKDTTSKSTGKPFDLSIGEVEIENFKANYFDDWEGIKTSGKIGGINVVFDVFDLNEGVLTIQNITLQNTNTSLLLKKPNKPKSSEKESGTSSQNADPFYITGELIEIINTEFQMEDSESKIKLYTDVEALELKVDTLNFEQSIYQAERIKIDNSFISFDQFVSNDSLKSTDSDNDSKSIELLAGSESTEITNTAFRFRDHNIDPTQKAFNPGDLWLQKINLEMKDGYFKKGDVEASIRNLSLIEKHGMAINKLEADVKYSDTKTELKGLRLTTKVSDLRGDLSVKYPSLDALSTNLQTARASIDFRPSKFGLSDLYYFQPSLRKPLSFVDSRNRIDFQLEANGSTEQLSIDNFELNALKKTELKLKGDFFNILNLENARASIDTMWVSTSANDVKQILGDSIIPSNITMPGKLKLIGSLQGGLDSAAYDLALQTSLGNVEFSGSTEMLKDSTLTYDVKTVANNVNIGSIIQNQQLGYLSTTLKISGKGIKPEQLNSKVKGSIDSIEYNGYTYKELMVEAEMTDKKLTTGLSFDDENLAFEINANARPFDSVPNYEAKVDLERADFQKLNFTNEDFKLRTQLQLDLNYKALNQLKGNLAVSDITFSKAGQVYMLDTVSLVAEARPDLADFHFKSSVVDIHFDGNFDILTLPDVLRRHTLFYIENEDNTSKNKLKSQQFEFNIDVKDPELISDIAVPGLKSFNSGIIKGSYNSEKLEINSTAVIYEATYKGYNIDSLNLEVSSDSTSFEFETRIKELTTSGFDFKNIAITASTKANQSIKADFKIFDDDKDKRYHIGGRFKKQDKAYFFSLLPGQFMLNYDEWTVDDSNKIKFLESGIWVDDINLTNSNQEIHVKSKVMNESDSALVLDFKEFDLSFIGKGKNDERYIFTGILDGSLSQLKESIKADISVKNLGYKGDTLGTVSLFAQNKNQVTDIEAKIKGNLNDVLIEGSIADNDRLDLIANFNTLNLSSLEAYTANQLSGLDGSLNGNLEINGTIAQPTINGKLNFEETKFTVNYLGATYQINDQVNFNNSGIRFSQFTITDESGDKLTVDGTIKTTDYKSFNFGIKLNATNFQLLNTTEKENDMVYGNFGISSTADITGSLKSPKIRTTLNVEPNSDVTYTIPESQIEVQNRKGVVEFFDADLEADEFFGKDEIIKIDSLETRWIKGIDLKANINVTNSSVFHVVIDPVNKDQLTVSGDADLVYTIKQDGSSTLSGRYEVSSGSYDLNFYGIAKRNFVIQPGSYLLWSGDPMNARIDVTAIYEVRAVPVDAEISQKLPFVVDLNIGGELLSPDISFALNLKDQGGAPSSVQAWVANINQQESILNKQVFSLLLFKSFISTGSGAGSNNIASTAARNSVSNILTNQLNKLGSKIKGLELTFDLQSYESADESGNTVGNTELELGLQKQFFDNRVVVKLAGNVDLEGENRQRQSASNFAGDIRIEYKLTEDGRFRLIGFRQNEYDDLLQGDIAETGVGIIFVRDYNTLKELFSSDKKLGKDRE